MIFRKDINGLRAWAVTLVVLFHFGVDFFKGGFLGVDIFFVISGFLMVGIIINRLEVVSLRELPQVILKFYFARARRILPALLFLCMVLIALGWLYLSPLRYHALATQIVTSIGFVSNNLFLQQNGYFDIGSHQKILLHTWSLSVEWQFYIVLPLVMSLAWIIKSGRKFQFLIISISCLASFGYCLYLSEVDKDVAFFSTFSRSWEMLVGGCVYFLISERKKELSWLANVGFIVIIGSAILLSGKSTWPGLATLLPVSATALIIYAGSNSFWTSGRLIQYVGTRSYSIYLWHWPLVVLIGYLGLDNSVDTIFFGVALTFLLAEASYRFVERGAIEYFLRLRLEARFVLSIVLILSVVLVGHLIRKADGYPSRLPESAVALSKYKFDFNDYRMGECFLNPEQPYTDFNACAELDPNKKGRTVLLWGDSHAAHLYPGIVPQISANENLIQLTASGCPPFINVAVENRVNCKAINSFVENWIKDNHPDQVILSARWSFYNWSTLEGTIDFLKRNGVKDVVVFGPAPIWNGILSDIMLNNVLVNGSIIPGREKHFLIEDAEVNAGIRGISEKSGARYVSVKDVFCNVDGCMTYLDAPNGPVPTAWDQAHLSSQASLYLIRKSELFK